eukprot:323138_1
MPSFLVILSFVLNVNSQNIDYCVWNHISSGSAINVNGQYTYNHATSYIKNIGSNCFKPKLYLRRNTASNAWEISDSSNVPIMQCSKSSLAQCTAGNWGSANPTVYVQAGSCPTWQCTSITTGITADVSDKGCQGPFTTSVGPNAWKHVTNELYFYFVPHIFKWVCYNSLQLTTCPVAAYMESDVGWNALSSSEIVNMKLTWLGAKGTQSNAFEINCEGSTQNPTKQTKQPTLNPTNRPTSIPTKGPIYSPTKQTVNPTKTTKNPSKIPTRTRSPSKKPTKVPSKGPSITTRAPSKIPTEANDADNTNNAEEKEGEDYSDAIEIAGYTFERTSFVWGALFGIATCSCGCCLILICQKMCSSDSEGRERVYSDEHDARRAEMAVMGKKDRKKMSNQYDVY